MIGRITNAVSVYVLNQSMGYMKYLKKESEQQTGQLRFA